MSDLIRISVDNGKYTVVQPRNACAEILRYGEPWLGEGGAGFPGVNAVLALAYELEEAREAVAWKSYATNKPQPGTKFVVAHTDGCSSGIYVMLDNGAYDAEDGENYGMDENALWCALPADYPIRFMEVTEDDWR